MCGVKDECSQVRQSSIREYFKSGDKGTPGKEPCVKEVSDITDEQCERAWIGADTVRILRDVRGDCRVMRGWCQDHNVETVKRSSYKNVWVRNSRTGLYQNKKRKVTVRACPGADSQVAATKLSLSVQSKNRFLDKVVVN